MSSHFDNNSEWQVDRPRPTRDTLVRQYNAKNADRARSARVRSQDALASFQQREALANERRNRRSQLSSQMSQVQNTQQPSSDRPRTSQLSGSKVREYRPENVRRNNLQGTGKVQRPVNSNFEVSERPAGSRRGSSRVRIPMTTQESHDRTQSSREYYEKQRARRDALASNRTPRTSNREVIDGRGSIDSRAFNEKNELVGYSIDQQDKPDPIVDTTESGSRWRSRGNDSSGGGVRSSRNRDLGNLSDTISGRSDYQNSGGFLSSVPMSVKVLAVVIVVLIIILVFILFR